jgi:hypothetical protein
MPQFQPDRIDSLPWNERSDLPNALQPGAVLQTFADRGNDGVSVEALEPGTTLEVTTKNTRYRLTIIDADGSALITGGSLFPNPTEVRVEGATAGGAALKIGWIGVGLRLELSIGGRVIVTSPVQSVEPVAA